MPAVTIDSGFIEANVPEIKIAPASEARIDQFMRNVAEKAEAKWKELAESKLDSTSKIYQDNIKIEEGFNSYYVILGNYTDKAPLALAVESGAPGFDMRPGLEPKDSHINRRLVPLWQGHSNPTVPVWIDKRDSDGWKHPGWKGIHLQDEVVDYIDKVVLPEEIDSLLNDVFDEMLGDF